jgi:hypothetical protein
MHFRGRVEDQGLPIAPQVEGEIQIGEQGHGGRTAWSGYFTHIGPGRFPLGVYKLILDDGRSGVIKAQMSECSPRRDEKVYFSSMCNPV